MAIDSAQKRSGTIEIPGLMSIPFPTGSIGAPDRHQISDIYPGIAAMMPIVQPSETCWRPTIENVSIWFPASQASGSWVNTSQAQGIWVKEKEVIPCQD